MTLIAELLAVFAECTDFEVVLEPRILEQLVVASDQSYRFVLVANTADLLAIRRHHIQPLKPIAIVERIRTETQLALNSWEPPVEEEAAVEGQLLQELEPPLVVHRLLIVSAVSTLVLPVEVEELGPVSRFSVAGELNC